MGSGMRTKIIYEDEHIIVVQKPSGLATQTAKVGQADVVSELKKYLGNPYLGVIHRLDQPVEGLLVFSKTRQTAAGLTKQLSTGMLNKKYYAVVCGKPKAQNAELVDYLLKDQDNRAKIVTGEEKEYPEAKKAILKYRVLHELSTPQKLALLDIHIETGRFHQIRAQMAHAGLPLLGDVKYGDEQAKKIAEDLGVRSVALCAYELSLIHPVTRKKLEFQVQPDNMAFCMEDFKEEFKRKKEY